jgi:hypothetical protein
VGGNRQADLLAQHTKNGGWGGGGLDGQLNLHWNTEIHWIFKKIRDYKILPNSSFVHIVRDVLTFLSFRLVVAKQKWITIRKV